MDFNQLEPETRCFAMIGRFLGEWAFMESELNQAIGKALGLDLAQEIPKAGKTMCLSATRPI